MTTSKRIGTSWTSSSAASKLLTHLSACLGLGYLPYAPGTFGSLPGILIFLMTRHWSPLVQGILFVLGTMAAIGISERAERISRTPDPPFVVIDEAIGMWAALLFLWRADVLVILAAMVLYRAFDITKIFPIRLFECFPGGIGIVADDLAAGIMANLVIRMLLLLGFFG